MTSDEMLKLFGPTLAVQVIGFGGMLIKMHIDAKVAAVKQDGLKESVNGRIDNMEKVQTANYNDVKGEIKDLRGSVSALSNSVSRLEGASGKEHGPAAA